MSTHKKEISKVIFDLDNTLIDTERIKLGLNSFLMTTYGFSKKEAKTVYLSARGDGEKVIFSRASYKQSLEIILAEKGLAYDESVIDGFFDNTNWRDFLLPGAIELIEYCQSNNIEMMLISLGNIDWQLEKIRNSGLDQYFSREKGNVILTHNEDFGKVDALREELENEGNPTGEGLVIVNDKPDETFRIMRAFSDITGLLRHEQLDKRYKAEAFDRMKEEFRGRIVVSDSLAFLLRELNKFKEEREYEPNGETDNR